MHQQMSEPIMNQFRACCLLLCPRGTLATLSRTKSSARAELTLCLATNDNGERGLGSQSVGRVIKRQHGEW